jgi:octaprenyl-diphosphate synthase
MKAKKNALEEFGRNLGIAFQIADDALDYDPDAKLGKKTGDDFREGKATLPVIYAYSAANLDEKKYLKDLFEDSPKARSAMQFKRVSEILQSTDSVKMAIDKSNEYADKARAALSIFDASEYKQALLDLLDFCVKRNY